MVFLVCGRRRPQLKRISLDSAPPTSHAIEAPMIQTVLLIAIAVLLAGVLAAVKKGFNEVIAGLAAIAQSGVKPTGAG